MLFTTVSSLLNDPRRWCQGAYARDGAGRPTLVVNSNTVCWCLMGACMVVYREKSHIAISKIEAHIGGAIGRWNDAATHDEVLSLVKELGL